MSVKEDQIIRELSHYIHEHPADETALMPLYDAALDHSRRRACAHDQRCPLVMTAAVVVDEQDRILCLRHEGGYALAEAEPEDRDDSLSEVALRLLAEEVGIRYLFRAASGAVLPSGIETGAAAWVPLAEVGIPALRSRLESFLIGT
ncbi:NUDIX hydrolase [Streptomyces sp. NPDC051567]|uniref:NUDIX hydrolase n=1 Tax=Streptomyces sp. NPDC051567 TaxID=3365660 RepID=UPI0037B11463